MKYYLLTVLLLMNSAYAKPLSLTLHDGEKKQIINIEKFLGFRVNNKCIELNEKCLALVATKIKVKLKKEKLAGHPASKACMAKGGNSIILQDKKRNDYDYCLFKDGSMINSWDLEKTK